MKNLFLLLLVIAATCSSCKKASDKIYKIDYSIGCTDCEVIYVSDQTGKQTTELNRNSSWTYSFNAKEGQEVLLLAYNTANNYQTVTATIKLNGEILKTRTVSCPINGLSFCVDTVR